MKRIFKKLVYCFAAKTGARINGLPVLNATIEDETDGMLRISLVDFPAVESDFLAFHKDTPAEAAPGQYKVVDEDKRIVYGVVMRADFPIYRCDAQNGQYFIVYTAETVRRMAEKYLADGRQNQVNIMHLAGSDQEGVHMVQWFIKDKAAGVDPAGFEAIEDGSLFAEFHIENDDIWAAIKAGEYRGFSIEVVNGLEPAQADTFAAIRNIMNDNSLTDMFKLSKIKELARKALGKFRSISTDKGVLSWDGDGDAAVGTKVYVPGEGEDAERQVAPDGDYKLEDGTVYVIAGGEITEIREAEAGTEGEGSEGEGAGEGNEGEGAENHEGEGEGQDPQAPATEPALEARVAALEEEVAGLEDLVEQLLGELSKFKKTPAAEPAAKRFRSLKPQGKAETGKARLKTILG